MVVSKVEFNAALNQINESYAEMNKKIDDLAALVEELKAPAKKPAPKAPAKEPEAA